MSTSSIPEDVLEEAVEEALDRGAEYSEARYHSITSQSLMLRNDRVIALGSEIERGIAVRVLVDGSFGFASTTKTSREDVVRAVEAAISSAKAASRHQRERVELSKERLGRASIVVHPKKSPQSLDDEGRIKLLRDLWKTVTGSSKKAKVPVLFQSIGDYVEEKLVVNSDGGRVYSSTPRFYYMYNLVLSGEGGYSLNRMYEFSAVGGVELLEEWNLEQTLENEVGSLENVIVSGRSPPRGKMDVIIGHEIVGLAVHESCGHPTEADRVLGREAAQGGMSFITKESIGRKIGSEHVNIVDDPTIPGSNGFYLYDDETVPARKRYLYKDGRIVGLLHNRWTGSVFGVGSNGSARSNGYRGEPLIRMANTYLEPGDHTFEELLEGVREGVYIKSYMEWNISDNRWSQRYVGLEAYYVRNGEILHPVKNPVLEVTTEELYTSIDALEKEVKFHAGMCGKGEPAQGIPVWFGGPNVRARGLRVG